MARFRTKPKKKVEKPSLALAGCVVVILIAIGMVTYMFFVTLNPAD